MFLDAFLGDDDDDAVPTVPRVAALRHTGTEPDLERLQQRGPALVCIHGFLGWGEDRPLWGMGPTYFPVRSLRRRYTTGPVVAVDVGVASSSHDRACEAFAQLLGIRCDYGAEHARVHGHSRFGDDWTGRALLNVWDGWNPVHLVGHSFGGNTALALMAMIANDFWGVGSDHSWVVSCTCIASPLAGCSLPFAVGYQGSGSVHGGSVYGAVEPKIVEPTLALRIMVALLGALATVQRRWPRLHIFKMRHAQWEGEHSRFWQWCTCTHPLIASEDSMLFDATPAASARALKAQLGALSSVYLIAVTSGSIKMQYASDASTSLTRAAVGTLVNPVSDAIRSSVHFGISAATSPRAAASLGRRVTGAAVGLQLRMLWKACTLWARLATDGPHALAACVCWLRGQSSSGSSAADKETAAAQQPGEAHRGRSMRRDSHRGRPPCSRRRSMAAERACELVREAVTRWLVRPAMRLSALLVERTAQALPAGQGLSARAAGSDGLVDTAAQRGVHVPQMGAGRRNRTNGSSLHHATEGMLRGCHSSGGLQALGMVGAASVEGHHGHSKRALNKGATPLQRGQWWVLNVNDADHSLGTALCQHSVPMYAAVVDVLERLPPLDTRELMRLRVARLSKDERPEERPASSPRDVRAGVRG